MLTQMARGKRHSQLSEVFTPSALEPSGERMGFGGEIVYRPPTVLYLARCSVSGRRGFRVIMLSLSIFFSFGVILIHILLAFSRLNHSL